MNISSSHLQNRSSSLQISANHHRVNTCQHEWHDDMAWHASLLFVPAMFFWVWYCIIRTGLGWRGATWPKSLNVNSHILCLTNLKDSDQKVALVGLMCDLSSLTVLQSSEWNYAWKNIDTCHNLRFNSISSSSDSYILLHHLQMNHNESRSFT
jgi:hypothetical protein